jgi:DivIVA domain-containing protein
MPAEEQTVEEKDGAAAAAPVVPAFGPDDLLDHVPSDIRSISFPVAVRGYDRGAVEAYVKRVNHVIAELEVSRSPQAAVRHALDRVGKQTIAVLQEARESADKLMAAAREEGDEAKARAKAEAARLVVDANADAERVQAEAEKVLADARQKASEIVAEARAEAQELRKQTKQELDSLRQEAERRRQEIQTDTKAVWKERGDLLAEVQTMAGRLQDLATQAAARVANNEPEQQPAKTKQA